MANEGRRHPGSGVRRGTSQPARSLRSICVPRRLPAGPGVGRSMTRSDPAHVGRTT